MKKIAKNIFRFTPIFILGVILISTSVSAQSMARFNTDPNDFATVRVSNYTLYPNSTSNWSTSASVQAGEIASVTIYYHNTSQVTAQNTRFVLNTPSGSGTSFSINGNVSADNASPASGFANISINSNQTLTYIPGSARWYPNQSQSAQALPNGQTGSEIFSGGLNIGVVAPGWSTQGSVVLRFQVSNTPPPPPQTQLPLVTTNSASSIGQNYATLEGYVNPNGSTDTVRWFEWGFSQGSLIYSTAQISQGSSASNFNESVSNLSANTTYYYRAVARNSAGVVYGTVYSFVTSNATQTQLPIATTQNAGGVTQTAATLNGYVSPSGSTNTVRWFEYYGPNGTTISTQQVAQYTASNVNDYVSNLAPGTTYSFRVVAQNSAGTAYGTYYSFATLGSNTPPPPPQTQLPLVTTNSASSIGQNYATLEGYVNPNGSTDTVRWFEWGTSQGSLTYITNQVSQGSSASNFNDSVPNFSANTTYYFRAVAQNSVGKVSGTVLSFTTLPQTQTSNLPTVQTNGATNITQNSATLNGYVNPSGSTDTTRWFEWGLNASSLGLSTNQIPQGSSAPNITIFSNDSIGGLSPNTTYYFRAVAQNSVGKVSGTVLSFTTTGNNNPTPQYQPSVTTISASNVGQSFATLEGYTNPNGSTDTVRWFEWGFSQGSLNYSTNKIFQGSSASNFSESVPSLSVNTTYYFRAVAQNSMGLAYGSVYSFTTTGNNNYYPPYNPPTYPASYQAPTVITYSATGISRGTAILNGYVNPNGSYDTVRWFEYYSNGSSLSTNRISQGSTISNFSDYLTTLTPNTTYHFRAIAQNSYGTNYGSYYVFTTDAIPQPVIAPPVIPPPSNPQVPLGSFSIRKEIENASFPNGTKLSVAAAAGNTIRYSIVLSNTGGVNIGDIKVTDTISQFVDFADASDGGSFDRTNGIVSWVIRNLQSGEQKIVTLNVAAKKLPDNVVAENIARAETSSYRTRVSNTTLALINTSPVILSITANKETVRPDETITYGITYKNEGRTEVKNLNLRVILPTGIVYENSNDGFSQNGNILTLNFPNLSAEESGSKSFSAVVDRSFVKKESITTTAVLAYTDTFSSAQKDVEAYVINTVEPGLSLLGASLFGAISKNLFVWLLLLFDLAAIAFIVYLLRKQKNQIIL